jgi:hypothetical protein
MFFVKGDSWDLTTLSPHARLKVLGEGGIQMERRKKKAGVWLSVIGFLVILALEAVVYAAVCLFALPVVLPVLLLAEGILLAAGIGILLAARARIQEINGGEEDDLSQY